VSTTGNRGRKLLVLGLDGVSYEMVAGAGRPSLLPEVHKFFAGKTARMSVSIPEISSVSWSSFMTGTQAGEHGIYGFVDLVPGTTQYRFPDFRDLKAIPFFDELGLAGRRSVIINLPATYPARPVPGVLISGFVALDLERAVYPIRYLPMLRQAGYQIDVDAGKGRDRKAEFLADLHCALKIRKQVADKLWEKEDWDLFMFTVTGTDRLQHFLYDACADDSHEFHADFLNFFHEVDQVAADFLQRAAACPGMEIVALSDHGFERIRSEVYLAPILKNNGFFSLDPGADAGRSLQRISADAKAFALDPSRLFIHEKGKYPRGTVAGADRDKVREDLKQLFENYEVGGRKAVRKAFFKEELYHGGQLAGAPDLVLLCEPGFDLKGGLEKNQETATSHFTGMHRQDNAFVACSRPELVNPQPTIFDVKALIYKLLEIRPVPSAS